MSEHYISTCPSCNDVITKDGAAPRERLCKCGTWAPYVMREPAYGPAGHATKHAIETLSSVIASAQGERKEEKT